MIMRTIVALLVISAAAMAQIFAPEGLNMPGAYDGWSQPPTKSVLGGPQVSGGTLLPNTDLGLNRIMTLINVQSSGGDVVGGTYDWKFSSGPTSNYYQNTWGSVTVSLNTIQTYTLGGGDNSVTLTNGKYYHVAFANIGYSNTKAIWMELSAAPVSITGVSDNFGMMGAGFPVAVTITLSAVRAPEERVFIRYTTDDFATWGIVEATGPGTTLNGTIPAISVTGTASNKYYVFSSTLSQATLAGLSGADVDLATLRYNTNSGANFALPVQMSSFTATAAGLATTLRWTTATEVDNAGFEVERRMIANGDPSASLGAGLSIANWMKIGFVAGAGTSTSPREYTYTDANPAPGRYAYRLTQIDRDGTRHAAGETEVEIGIAAKAFSLHENYPNPFNPATTISFTLAEPGVASLRVFNVLGQEVATLFNGAAEAGRLYQTTFNADGLPSGLYFAHLESGRSSLMRKMVLAR